MTTTHVLQNDSDSLDASDLPSDQENSLHTEDEGAVDILFLSDDIDSESAANSEHISSLESSFGQSVNLSRRSIQPFKKKSGKRAFAIANKMAKATSIENLYQIAVSEIRKRFQVERGLIYQFHSETHGTVIAESQSGDYRPMLGEIIPAIAFGKNDAESYKQQASVSIANASESTITPYQAQLFNQFQVRANLSLPIFLEDQLWGLLAIQQCEAPREWTEQEIGFLYLVASELQISLQPLNFQLERQLLVKLSDKLRQAADKDTVFRSTTRDIRKFLDVDRLAICQFRQDYSLKYVFESKVGNVPSMLDVVLEDSHLKAQEGGIFRQNKPFVVHNVTQDSTLTPCHTENLSDYDINACAIVAIYQGENLWGLLGAYQHDGPRRWTDKEISLLAQAADLIGVSLHQSELMVEMRKAAKNQEALPEIVNRISNTAYTEKIYQTAVEEVRQLLNVEHACIYKFRSDYFGDFVYESQSGGWPNMVGSAWEDTYVQQQQGGRFRNTEQPFLADDVYTAGLSECHLQTLEYFGIKSFLIVAIRQGGKLWGLLSTFQHSGPRHWLESDVKALQEISRQMEASLRGADYIAQLQEQSAQMAKMAQLGRSVSELVPQILQAKDTAHIFKLAQRSLRQLLKCDQATIYRFNPDWTHTLLASEAAGNHVDADWASILKPIWPKTNLEDNQGGPYRDNETLVVNNIYTSDHSPTEIEILEACQINAYLTAPIFKEGQLWGVLSVYQKETPRSWAEAEVNVLQQIGLQIGTAMQQVDYLKELSQTTQKEQLLSTVTERLRQSADLPNALKAIARDIRQLLQADRVGLYQFDPETNYSVGKFVVEDIGEGVRSAMDMKIQDQCFAEGQSENYREGRYWVVEDVQSLDLPECLIALLDDLQVRASLVVPLLKGNMLWGLFAVHQCKAPRHWQESDVQFVHRVGAQLNIALQQADYLSQVEEKTAKLMETAEREKASKELIQQQVMQLLQAVGPALQGDLTVQAQVTETEVGTVASAYNSTLKSLQKIVLQVQSAVNEVGESSKLSEMSALTVKKQAEQQAKSLDKALERVQTMMSSTEAVAKDAQQVEAAAKQANEVVQHGDAAMNRTVDGIMAIRSTVAETNQRIKRLSESSQKVSKIVSLISNFTTQTQLLALNASIEATRAGEYGRGFIVVADEVRSLARQSAEAATEIEQFVQEIQIGTAEVSSAMETGIQQVAQGTDLVADARQNLTAIVKATDQISQLIEDITQTTYKQAHEFKVVTQSMTEATDIAKQTSVSSNALSQSIQQVLNTAETLQSSADKFKVK